MQIIKLYRHYGRLLLVSRYGPMNKSHDGLQPMEATPLFSMGLGRNEASATGKIIFCRFGWENYYLIQIAPGRFPGCLCPKDFNLLLKFYFSLC